MSAVKKAKPAQKARVARKAKPAQKARVARKVKPAQKARAARKARPAQKNSVKKARPAKKAAAAIAISERPPATNTYMSARQREWFRKKLGNMLLDLCNEVEQTAQEMREKEKSLADELDRAHNEFAFVVDLKENDRIIKLQVKINHALRLIDSGAYGICDDCGIDIGINRMVARPVATKCIDCKEFQEELEHNAK